MNPSIVDIFVSDARKYLSRMRDATDAGLAMPDSEGIRRSARRLQHAASLAHQEVVLEAATVLQKTAVQIIAGKRDWSDDLGVQIRTLLGQVEKVVDAQPVGDVDAETALRQATAALLGVQEASRDGAAHPAEAPAGASPREDDEAEAELAALVRELGEAVERLESDPRDRQPLKAMLRRIRRLRELGRIEPVSPADRALTAVEELILQIADLNATVGPGYLTVFRHAREVMERLQAAAAQEAGPEVSKSAVDVDELKDQVMEKARRARVVIWVSDLFFAEGSPIVQCPIAEDQSGSTEQYFHAEATKRLDRCEKLRSTMLEADSEQMRLAGESLAYTLRHLRERAVAFNHAQMGRVVRRAAAALRAQLVRPPAQVRALALGFGDVFVALRAYLENEELAERDRAVSDAELALRGAVLGGEPTLPAEAEEFDQDRALQRALELRTRVDERLRRLSGPEVQGLKGDFEALFDLIAYYESQTEGEH